MWAAHLGTMTKKAKCPATHHARLRPYFVPDSSGFKDVIKKLIQPFLEVPRRLHYRGF
jgi:hypothetical protein